MASKKLLLFVVTMMLSFPLVVGTETVFAPAGSYVDAGPDQVVKVGTEVTLSCTILFSGNPYYPPSPHSYELHFGDGSPALSGAVTAEVMNFTHSYASVGAHVASFTVNWYGPTGELIPDTATATITVLNPTIETYDAAAPDTRKDTFGYLEAIQINGSGYLPSFNPPTYRYWIWIENDTTWVDNMTLPGDWGRIGPVSTSSGNLETVLIPYHWYLLPGKYDIVVDVDDDGVYDEGLDALDDLDINGAGFVVTRSTIESCDSTGATQDTFDVPDDVYVTGTGYAPSRTHDLYVVADEAVWHDNMTIPPSVAGTAVTLISDAGGNVPATLAWTGPLVPGTYDIVVDVNRNGIYDAELDALDDMDVEISAGFHVIPEVPLGTVLASLTMIIGFACYLILPRTRKE